MASLKNNNVNPARANRNKQGGAVSSQNTLPPFKPALLIICCCLASIFFLNKEVKKLANDIHWGDETISFLVLRNIDETFLPGYGRYADCAASPLDNPETLKMVYGDYAVELYLRYPFYALSKVFDYDWKSFSSLAYVYLIFILIIYRLIKNKSSKLPAVIVGFFIVLMSLSNYASSEFHYVRYYPFTIIFMSFIPFVCIYFYTYRDGGFKRNTILLLLALTPGFFHAANFSYFFYWVVVLVLFKIKDIIKDWKKKGAQIQFSPKQIALAVLGSVLLIGLALIAYSRAADRLTLGAENLAVIPKFIEFFLGTTRDKIIFLAGFVLIYISFKQFSGYEKNLLFFSLGFIAFCLTGFSVIGGSGIVGNYYTYMMFMFPSLIIITSIMLYSLLLILNRYIFNFPFKVEVIFSVLIISVAFADKDKFMANENRARGTIKEYNEIKAYVEKYPNCVFVTSDNSLYFYAYFPKNKAYLFRTYKDIKDTMQVNEVNMYNDKTGHARNIYGEYLIGKYETFTQMLKENTDKKICLYNVSPGLVEPDLMAMIQKNIVCNPFSADYLLTMMTSYPNKNEAVKQYKELLGRDNLFPLEYVQLSNIYFNIDLYDETIEAANKAVKAGPGNLNAYLNICAACSNLKKWNEALAACEKALEIDPNSQQAKNNMEFIKSSMQTKK